MRSFLDKYFQTGAANGNLAHCILFYGADAGAQYELALETARLLNCTGDCSEDCECLNCRWIRENKHPAVATVSKVDGKPAKDMSKTVISIEQARMLKNDLAVTSDYHRVFIFCDKDSDGRVCGLNRNNFQEETANALLKTFEEPPARTTFFFLTKDKDDMISTIISRAQSFFVPSMQEEPRDFLPEVAYLEVERGEVRDWYERIIALTKENAPAEVLRQLQNYILSVLRSNPASPKLIRDLKLVETAQNQLRLDMDVHTVAENLAFGLIL